MTLGVDGDFFGLRKLYRFIFLEGPFWVKSPLELSDYLGSTFVYENDSTLSTTVYPSGDSQVQLTPDMGTLERCAVFDMDEVYFR